MPVRTTHPTPPSPSLLEDPRLQKYIESLRRADLANLTVRGYVYDLQTFLRWWQGDRSEVRLEHLTTADLIAYRNHLVGEKQARPATVNRRLEALRRFCRWAHQNKVLEEDVVASMHPLRTVPRHRPQGLSKAETDALLRTAGTSRRIGPRNYALVQCFLQTGLRVEEMASLRVVDITLHGRSGMVRVRHGKGGKEREVPLNTAARRALQKHLDDRGAPDPQEPLFVSERGQRLSVRAIQHTIQELARRAGIKRLAVSPHVLRHTFSIHYLEKNTGRLDLLAALLGHESLDTTAIYARPSLDQLAASLEQIHVTPR